jgi:uncharacterized protein (TIGR02246 family)
MDEKTTSRPTLAGGHDHPEGIAAIRAVIADIELGYNTKDPAPAVEHFSADALVINASGAVVAGWDAIQEAHRAGFTGFLKGGFVRYGVGPIMFVQPDVAIALKEARATEADGTLIDEQPAMRALYVLVRQGVGGGSPPAGTRSWPIDSFSSWSPMVLAAAQHRSHLMRDAVSASAGSKVTVHYALDRGGPLQLITAALGMQLGDQPHRPPGAATQRFLTEVAHRLRSERR